jgi:hypothetical protein
MSRRKPRAAARAVVIATAPKQPRKLDLGSGPRPAEGYEGVDIVPGVTTHSFDLANGTPWPFADDSVGELRSCHFIEHVPMTYVGQRNQDALLWFFDEAYRIAVDGATFTLQWPALQSVRAFQDPTHRRFIPAETLAYLSRENRRAMGLEHYRVSCNWVTLACNPTVRTEHTTRAVEVQRRMYRETWGFSEDFVATLKAVKA